MESFERNWREEKQSAHLYDIIATYDDDPVRKALFSRLRHAADEQAAVWRLKAPDGFAWTYVPTLRVRVIAALVRRIGIKPMRAVLWSMKVRGMSVFDLARQADGHPMPNSVEEIGKRHHSSGTAGNLRAAVFGVNDGLISNASLILGIVGASADPHTVLVAGIAGGLAGAFSMAAGEFVSVKSQREMLEYQIDLEREELAEYPEEEAAELALIYEARGLSRDIAKEWATRMVSNPEEGLKTLVREELGVDPDDLSSPWAAGFFSFSAFAIGSLVPLMPFVLRAERPMPWVLSVTAIALFGVGAAISLFTGRGFWKSGFRMVAIGGGAGLLTYLIGRLLINL